MSFWLAFSLGSAPSPWGPPCCECPPAPASLIPRPGPRLRRTRSLASDCLRQPLDGLVDGSHQALGLLTFTPWLLAWSHPSCDFDSSNQVLLMLQSPHTPLGPRTTLSRAPTRYRGTEDHDWFELATPALGHPPEAWMSV